MTRLIWDKVTERSYETGVDRGVFYPGFNEGSVWNGLVSVDESVIGGDKSPLFYDGIKYYDFVANSSYKAQLTAYSAPEAFYAALGEMSPFPGLVLTKQKPSRFGLSYRTMSGSGYKIHLVYNVLAVPSTKDFKSISDSIDPSILAWNITGTDVASSTHKPSSHLIIDSTTTSPAVLTAVENTLYGTSVTFGSLPLQDTIIGLFS